MRNISAAALTFVTQQKGVEPVIVVEIQWINGGPILRYSDKEFISDGIEGRIITVSDLENVINVSKTTTSQNISITLDDTDGVLKNIYNNNDIHKRTVQVFQWFTGLAYADRFLIFEGVISSPISWKEGDRTLSFEVISKLEDKEIGFSPEEGQFDEIPDELIGQTWPLPFGTVLKVTAKKLDPIPAGLTLDPDGLADENIQKQIEELGFTIQNLQLLAQEYFIKALQAYTTAHTDENGSVQLNVVQSEYEDLGDQFTDKGNETLALLAKARQDLHNLIVTLQKQKEFEKTGIRVYDGSTFPQNSNLDATFGDTFYSGRMAGDTYQITSRSREDPNVDTTEQTTPVNVTLASSGQVAIQKLGFRWVQSGLNFKMINNLPVRYIVAALPVTILNVYAYRNFKENRVVMTVPTNYYSVSTQSFGSITATIITLVKPLSAYRDQNWDDEIFVDIQSSIGPNTVSIIQYLIQTYTSLSIDAASFAATSTAVNPFPSNFCIFDRKNIVQALSEIAYQARCAIWINNNTFYLRYLPNEPASVDTITEADILHNTFEISNTPTEDVVTKLVATYKTSYDQEREFKIILRHNVEKYGIQQEETNWYIYNNLNLVDLAATFWLIRKANTWKIVKFRTPLHKLKLETFDAVTLNFSNNYSHIGSVVGIIESVRLDSESLEIEFEIWIPVRLGEMTKYNFAFPIDDQVNLFPTTRDLPGGGGPGKNATGSLLPTNNAQFRPTRQRLKRERRQNIDHGFYNPGGQVDASVQLTTQLSVNEVAAPQFDYEFNQFNVPPFDETAADVPMTMPGKVINEASDKPGSYRVTVYPKGLDGDTKVAVVRSSDPEKKFSANQWVMVMRVVWKEKDQNNEPVIKSEYDMIPFGAKSTFPGKVLGGSGNTYSVAVYINGLGGAPVTKSVRVLQIDTGETIPVNTWLLVAEGQKPDGGEEFTMQPPIWLE